MRQTGVIMRGAKEEVLDPSTWIWYLNATLVLWMLARLREYSPVWSGIAVMKAGFGATFSRRVKFSRRRSSDCGWMVI